MTRPTPPGAPHDSRSPHATLWQRALPPLRALGFWAGVLAPLAYPPLLVGGLGWQSLLALCGVVCMHVVGLAVGRQHRAD